MFNAVLKTVETPPGFWKSLEGYRDTSVYWGIRSAIADAIVKGGLGQPMGDKPFTGNPEWGQTTHLHLNLKGRTKLIAFMRFPDPETVQLAEINDHSAYRFKNEGSGRQRGTIARMRTIFEQPHVASPDWKSFSWSDPRDILTSPEVGELSEVCRETLINNIDREVDTFERFSNLKNDMGRANFLDEEGWFDALAEAQNHVLNIHAAAIRNTPHEAHHFIDWGKAPGGHGPAPC